MRSTISFKRVVETYRIETVELETWIANRWVVPDETKDGYAFDDIDRARIALIRDLRDHLMVNDDSLTLVLSLLDQLYTTRRALKSIEAVVETLPEETRDELRARLQTVTLD